jgi:carbon-monoxide dehydrogenase medium subunit/xanthine dehydrogenase FAD-binding subunit
MVTKIDEEGVFQDTRVVPGSATPYPQSLPESEKAINGKSVLNIDLEGIGKITSKEMVSITGERWSTPYKKPTIAVLIKRALEKIIKEAKTDD